MLSQCLAHFILPAYDCSQPVIVAVGRPDERVEREGINAVLFVQQILIHMGFDDFGQIGRIGRSNNLVRYTTFQVDRTFSDAIPPQAMANTLALSGPVLTATNSVGIG